MKRIILFAFMVTTVMMSHAAVSSVSDPQQKPGSRVAKSTLENFKKSVSIKLIDQVYPAESCTITMKGSISGGVFSVEVSCTASATTCDQAASKATTCLSAAIKRARQALS